MNLSKLELKFQETLTTYNTLLGSYKTFQLIKIKRYQKFFQIYSLHPHIDFEIVEDQYIRKIILEVV